MKIKEGSPEFITIKTMAILSRMKSAVRKYYADKTKFNKMSDKPRKSAEQIRHERETIERRKRTERKPVPMPQPPPPLPKRY